MWSAVVAFLMSCWAFAATKEMEGGVDAPAEMVDVLWVVVFVVLFFGMIAAFFVWFWLVERKKKKSGESS